MGLARHNIHEHIMFIGLLLVETFNLKFRGYHPWGSLKKKFVVSSSEFPCGKGGFKMESCVNVIIMRYFGYSFVF